MWCCCHRRVPASTCSATTKSAAMHSRVQRGRCSMARAATATLEMHNSVRSRTRLGTGWEAPSLLLITVALLSFGFVSVYSASAVNAMNRGVAHYYFVLQQ